MNTYLRLQPAEEAWVNEEMEPLDPGGKERSMFWTDWHEKGFREGAHQGMQQGLQEGLLQGRRHEALGLVLRLVRACLGPSAEAMHERIERLSTEQLEELALVVIRFASVADLVRWLEGESRDSRPQ